ncbi:cell division protein PerM [Gordonia sp. NPDC003424]
MPAPPTDSLASRLRQMRQLSRAQRSMSEGSARELVVVAFAVPVLTMALVVLAVLAILLLAGSGLAGLGTTVGALWLAIHQVPVTISGVTIGVLPLLPTLAIAAATARMAWSASGPERPTSELTAVGLAAVGGPLLMTALSLAVMMDGASVTQVQSPVALIAFAYTLGIHAAAAAGGIAFRRRQDLFHRFAVTGADRRGLRLGVVAVTALLGCGAVVVLVRLIVRWHDLGSAIAAGNDFDGYLGLTLLSVLYLPNAVVGAAAVLVGSDVHLGTASVDLFTVHPGPLPPLPVVTVIPQSAPGTLGLLACAVPAGIALVVAFRCRDVDPLANVRSVAVAGAVAASAMVLLCAMAGGALGEFGAVGITVPTVGVFTLGWIIVVGLVVALIHGCLPSTRAARLAVDDELWDDDEVGYDDDYLTDEFDDEYADEYSEDDEYGEDDLDVDPDGSDHTGSDYTDDEYSDDEFTNADTVEYSADPR